MATKTDRTIKFTYNLNTYTQNVPIANEVVNSVDIYTMKQAIDGSWYQFVTGETNEWTYSFSDPVKAIFDFFNNAYVGSKSYDVTFDWENDDGTFTTYNVLIEPPTYNHQLMGDSDGTDPLIAYRDFKIDIKQK